MRALLGGFAEVLMLFVLCITIIALGFWIGFVWSWVASKIRKRR